MRREHPIRIDWSPLLPRLLALMEEGRSARAICKELGVSHKALNSAIERSAPAKLRADWKRKWRAPAAASEVTRPVIITRPALEAGSSVTWSALWNGPAPAFPEYLKRSRLS
ncbi:hypothetical protein M2305_000077 [Gluconobacter cerinus]|uniref:Clp protease N-terminal domain-containing protein n=1 Tax=Gluconobacter cerinus TaxID=38307 RepID=UPI002226413C|nr:Clp protease N-terminal domain-containing protein [Gluconobacter cerinus]MCW2264130.1 hypothetical protein [Gluconobacter cerinus]